MTHICPNNLSLWQSMTKPQQTNEHMREVINHSTHTHVRVGERNIHPYIKKNKYTSMSINGHKT